MSLIIKGMEMPEQLPDLTNTNALTEYNCQIFIDSKGNASLRIRGHKEEYPIVKLSAAHGRLIDADVLIKDLQGLRELFPSSNIDYFGGVISLVEHCPTVIEAEKRRENNDFE